MKFSLSAIVIGASLAAAESVIAAAQSPQDIVDNRVTQMKTLGGAVKGASEAATAADAKAKIAAALKIAESVPAMFPKGTGIGDTGVTKTRALQDIWAKPAEFKSASDALVAALKNVDAAIGAGDKAKTDAAFGDVFKNCKGCHMPFRGPEAS